MKIELLASQIVAMVHMMFRTCGTFPLSPNQKENSRYQEIVEELRYSCPAVKGGWLEDAPGMGKTITALLYYTWWALYAPKEDHRPTLLLGPDSYVFKQSVDAIMEYFLAIMA